MKERSRHADGAARQPPHPRLGQPSLTIPSEGADGRPAPQGRVRVADRIGRFDDLVGGGWQLISRRGDPTEVLDTDDRAWFGQIGGVLADVSGNGAIQDLESDYERWFKAAGALQDYATRSAAWALTRTAPSQPTSAALNMRIGGRARRDRQPVMARDLNDPRGAHHDPARVLNGHRLLVISQCVGL
jgi:hypothetical protein